jgi:hypothetical protein
VSADRHRLLRIALAGLNDIEEWRLGDPARAAAKGYPREYLAEVLDDHGIVFLDVVVEEATGRIRCHEVNGPNAVGSDALTGESFARAENEARQAAKVHGGGSGGRAVTLHAHQHWRFFRTGGEFFPRVADFAEALGRLLPGRTVHLRGAAEPLGAEDVAVVMGDVPSVASHMEIDARGRLSYRGRRVIFAGNPNLLTELVRTGKVRGRDLDLRAFHAWRLVRLVHDKGRQQDLFEGTGIEPLRYFAAATRQEAIEKTRALLAHGPVVLKPNNGSGGTGVHVAVPAMSDGEIAARVEAVLRDYAAKHGENSEAIAFPIRGFEFVRSTGYDGRLWDLRIAVLFEPGKASVFPVSMRLTPTPFDPLTFHEDRDQWISNVSGRQVTLLKSGMDDEALAAVGMTPGNLEQVFRASVLWTMRAWDAAARMGGPGGSVYEDLAEVEDAAFYPREKFRG